jgi:hypothetical protein
MSAFVTARLGDLSARMTVGASPTVAGFQFVESGVNFIPTGAFTPDGFLDTQRFTAISRIAYEAMPRAQITTDDVLVCLFTTGILKATIAASHDLPAATGPAVAIIGVRREDILPKFLAYALNGRPLSRPNKQKENAKTYLSLAKIRDIKIRVPPLSQQQHLCEQMESYDARIRNCQRQLRIIQDEILQEFDELVSVLPPNTLIRSPRQHADREGLPIGWRWVSLAELVENVRDMIVGEESRLTNSIGFADIEGYSATIASGHRVASGAMKLRFDTADIVVGPRDKRNFKVAMALHAGLAPRDFTILRPQNDYVGAFVLFLMRSTAFAEFRGRYATTAENWSVLKKWNIAVPADDKMKFFGGNATVQLRLSGEITQSYRHLLVQRRAMVAEFAQPISRDAGGAAFD